MFNSLSDNFKFGAIVDDSFVKNNPPIPIISVVICNFDVSQQVQYSSKQ